MTRLRLLLVAPVVGAVLLSGCGASSNAAATVSGHDISRQDLDRDLRAIRDNKALAKGSSTPLSVSNGTVDARLTALWVAQLVEFRLVDQLFAQRHLEVTAQDRAAAKQQAEQFFGSATTFDAFPRSFQNRFVDALARSSALARALAGPTPNSDTQTRVAAFFRNALLKAHIKVNPRFGTAQLNDQGFQVVPPSVPNPREKPGTTTTTAAPNPLSGATPSG